MSTNDRDTFLTRVRDAVRAGNAAGASVPLKDRGTLGYQGGGSDLGQRFKEQCEAAGGRVHVVDGDAAARERVVALLRESAARRILLGANAILDRIGVPTFLADLTLECRRVEATAPNDRFFDAELSVTGADYLIAETGSIILLARPDEPRSVSLLPPVHIVVADGSQILPDFFDVFARIPVGQDLPSCISVITGPSKTGDIELRLVTGVHGPGEVHVVLITASPVA